MNVNKYKVCIEGTSPILQHKFNGKDEEKAILEKSDTTQAEFHAYKLSNGNIGIPSEWIKGCLREYLVAQAAPKTKRTTLIEVAPRIQISPFMLDLDTKEYIVDKRAIPVKIQGKIANMGFCVRPMVEEWKAEFTLITTLDKTLAQWKSDIEGAGIDTGIGANRINGYGRFRILTITKV